MTEQPNTLPDVIVVGSQPLADLLARTDAQWTVHPAVPTIDAMWDSFDAGTLPSSPNVAVFTYGTAPNPEDFALNVAAFAPYADIFVVADPSMADAIVQQIVRAGSEIEDGDPNKPIHILPANDLNTSIQTLQRVTAGYVNWMAPQKETPAPIITPPPSPHAQSAPQPAPITHVTVTQEQAQPAPQPAPQPTQAVGYEQANVYAQHIHQQAAKGYAKPGNARPGQTTIAVMSSKGGSGKSTTALCLAGMIATSSAAAGDPKKVALVDLDTRDGQVGSLIGQYVPTAVNIRVLPRWDAPAVTENLVHDRKLGVDALLAPIRPRNADDVGPDFYSVIIQVLQTTHDVVIIDCSVNYLDPLLGVAFSLSDEILFVTTLATTSVQGMARALTELFADPSDGGLGIPREKVGVVANQVINNVGMGKDKLLRAALGAPLVGQIPAEQDAVLVATNSNRISDLLKHPRLGPAYYKLATTCLPGWNLAPLAVEQPAHPAAGNPQAAGGQKKGRFFRRG